LAHCSWSVFSWCALSADDYGNYVFVLMLANVVSELILVGLRTVAVRNGTVYVDRGEWGLLTGLV
jgi:hypothetical protein